MYQPETIISEKGVAIRCFSFLFYFFANLADLRNSIVDSPCCIMPDGKELED